MIELGHPTGRANFTRVTLHELTVWFSDETPIAFTTGNGVIIGRQNKWGPATGRHLLYLGLHPEDRIQHKPFLDALAYAYRTAGGLTT